MARKATLELKRGDTCSRRFYLPISLYEVGATLGFTAKTAPDNDTLDTAAVISKTFTDANVDLVTNPSYAIYTLTFIPTDTSSIIFASDETQLTYVGEFQYTPPSTGFPKSYPGNDDYVEVIVYADVRRKTP